jgi:hypothetical protein
MVQKGIKMKVYFRFDNGSVDASLRHQITAANSSLTPLDGELYAFQFNPVVFTHAWQLLGKSSTRFGNDLSPYLACTHDFFTRSVQTRDILSLQFGTADFKKRISEDLGVSIASLFMVQSFGIQWHTIAQIPENRNLSKSRPDFEGFTTTGDRYLYEAKGRSVVGNVIPAIEKAVSQVKEYPESALHKLALVTYLSSDERAFASHTFLLDPQMPDAVLPSLEVAEQLHFLNVLDFGGLFESRKAYLVLLKAWLAHDLAERSGTLSRGHVNRVSKALTAFIHAFEEDIRRREKLKYVNASFIIQSQEVASEHGKFRFTNGIHEEVANRIRSRGSSKLVGETSFRRDHNGGTSLFTDGTLLRIEIMQ